MWEAARVAHLLAALGEPIGDAVLDRRNRELRRALGRLGGEEGLPLEAVARLGVCGDDGGLALELALGDRRLDRRLGRRVPLDHLGGDGVLRHDGRL